MGQRKLGLCDTERPFFTRIERSALRGPNNPQWTAGSRMNRGLWSVRVDPLRWLDVEYIGLPIHRAAHKPMQILSYTHFDPHATDYETPGPTTRTKETLTGGGGLEV
jgi:hypothetical protein